MLSGYNGVCYIDDATRILKKLVGEFRDNTPSKCKSECGKRGYSLAGVQAGRQCFCGNNMAFRARTAPSKDCNRKCPGDGNAFCGGSWRMNIYSIKENKGDIDLATRTSEQHTCIPIAQIKLFPLKHINSDF